MDPQARFQLISDDYRFRTQIHDAGYPDPGMSDTIKQIIADSYGPQNG